MNDLLERVIAAHGGLDRWNTFTEMTATMLGGGGLWPMKGFEPAPIPTDVTITLHEENSTISPFGGPERRAVFNPHRVAIESTDGTIIEERSNPRASFAGHVMDTPWDLLQRAYFSGYARWTYLTTPFFMTMPALRSRNSRPGEKVTRYGAGYARGSQRGSPAIAKNKTSTSATISFCADMITTSRWRAGFRRHNMFTTSWRRTACAFRRNDVLTCVGQDSNQFVSC